MVVSWSSTRLVFIADFNQHDLAIHDCVIARNAFQAPLCKKKQLLFNKENDAVKIKMDCTWGYVNCLASFSKFIFLAL